MRTNFFLRQFLKAKPTTLIGSLLFLVSLTQVEAQQNKQSKDLKYPIKQKSNSPFEFQNDSTPLYLSEPSNIRNEITYDPERNEYKIQRKIGDRDYGPPIYKSFDEYKDEEFNHSLKKYWVQKVTEGKDRQSGGIIPKLHVGGQVFETIFGSNKIDIRPQGSAEIKFGVIGNRIQNPQFDIRQQRTVNFDFQQKIQMNVSAKIGERIELQASYNTEASFEFENKMNLTYEGDEDDILQKIELGNVTLPLPGTLITGSQSLFGIKTQLKFGKATITSIFSQQKSESKSIDVAGGAQITEFEIKADEYEDNRHFFIAQYFKDSYEQSLSRLPIVNSPITITKIEVWVTNLGAPLENTRNIVAFQDLGENKTENIYNNSIHTNIAWGGLYDYFPENRANDLYSRFENNAQIRSIDKVHTALTGFTSGVDYEFIENARQLDQTEYYFNSKLGFISLNSVLNPDQVLAVAFQYRIIGDTTTYQVGEFSNGTVEGQKSIIVKLLKSTATNTKIPLWELMMKNVYALGGYQINGDDFRFNILYEDDENGVPAAYLPQGKAQGMPLIRLLRLDTLNTHEEYKPDGLFDFIDGAATGGGTIQSGNGRIYFPVLEPFGKSLRQKLIAMGESEENIERYCYDSLYTLTKFKAQEFPEKNKFVLEGSYKSSVSNEISLNAMNIPQGSVKVTAGGIELIENIDFTVDYTLGRVKIINDAYMNSGMPIRVSYESNSLFNIQTKTLIGTHIDYQIHKDFIVGGTIMNLTERPLTQKINLGDEPISNTIWGLNSSYKTKSELLTKLVDKLPFIDTKAESNITIEGEFAHLIPGHSKAIGKTGTAYIDDFEGSKSSIDLKSIVNWKLASTPSDAETFTNGNITGLQNNFNRAKIAYYSIDPIFYGDNSATPDHIRNDASQLSNHFVRQILETEVFPNKELPSGQPSNLPVLNLAYYPSERGMYNFNPQLTNDGQLRNPENNWAGIMRSMSNISTDFEATNVEYIEFWMMDPFVYEPEHSGGTLYFHLGDISEDILKDGRKSFENGLPTSTTTITDVDTTVWGRIPNKQALVTGFDNAAQDIQDVGLDGLSDADERIFFQNYINAVPANAQSIISEDPAADNFHYFRGSDYDNNQVSILNRYKNYNLPESNSPTESKNKESYPTSGTNLPDKEDINEDNTLNQTERYFEYKIELKPDRMTIGENFITDIYESVVPLKNGTTGTVKWYQFKIPVTLYSKVYGDIQDFKSIRFMRLALTDFTQPVVCRFATFELVRGEWRKLTKSLLYPGEYIPNDNNNTTFNISTVNIEENGKRKPVPYVLPPDIERETNIGSSNQNKLNEQSLSLSVSNLEDGDARAIYKTTDFDFRRYGKIKMFVHAEAKENEDLNDNELTAFIRLGNDFTDNYYEYEVPLTLTPIDGSVSSTEEKTIWPEANEINLYINELTDAKQARNLAMRANSATSSLTTPYITYDGKNKITVLGNPNLGDVKVILIGVRNPKRTNNSINNDDGLPKSAELWINELRMTDFDENGGWAANTRVSANLADLGNVVLAGTYSTAGFGSIEQKINERQNENILRYDVATNVELGKFLPEKSGIRIPMHVDFSETKKNPEYNPLNPDIKLKKDLETYKTKDEKKKLLEKVQDYTMQRSINFTNVRKEKVGANKKNHFYDVENLDFTYAYTETFHRDFDIQHNLLKTYNASVGYNFNNNAKNYKPLSKVKFINKAKYLTLIKDFNFYLLPQMFSFRNEFNRAYEENLYRNKSEAIIPIDTNYIKSFDWNRNYVLKYDLTKGLKVDYNANASSWIIEPEGRVDKGEAWKPLFEQPDSARFGELTTYAQNINVTYNIPINKLPLMDWLTLRSQYSGQYSWDRASPAAEALGNTINSSNTYKINTTANMVNLYNKINYLKQLNKPKTNRGKRPQNFEVEEEEKTEDTTKNKNFNTEIFKLVLDNTLKTLMAVKNINYNLSRSVGVQLPGFKNTPILIGQDWNSTPAAPGMAVVFGNPFARKHDDTLLREAFSNEWLTTDSSLNSPFTTQYIENHNFKMLIEPVSDLKIDLTADWQISSNKTFYFRATEDELLVNSPMEIGNFSMSFITWQTAWVVDHKKTNSNKNFENFLSYRDEVSQRFGAQMIHSNGFFADTIAKGTFADGYGPTSQQVLISSFLAAYSGSSPESVTLDAFPKIPLPNWRITYDGLSKIEFVKRYLKRLSLSHGYRSAYTVANFATLIQYQEGKGIRYENGNFLPEYEISQVAIREQFSPLLKIDMTWHNSLNTNIEVKKSREISLSFINYQITELLRTEYIFGAGYRIQNFPIYFGGKKPEQNDLNVSATVSISNNRTVLRKIIEETNTPSSGQRMIKIDTYAEYQISKALSMRLYFARDITKPIVSNDLPRASTQAGISFRFTLFQ